MQTFAIEKFQTADRSDKGDARRIVEPFARGGFVGDADGNDRYGDGLTAEDFFYKRGARLAGIAAAPAGAVAEVGGLQ